MCGPKSDYRNNVWTQDIVGDSANNYLPVIYSSSKQHYVGADREGVNTCTIMPLVFATRAVAGGDGDGFIKEK